MNFVGRQVLRIFKNEISNQTHVCGLGRRSRYRSAYALDNLYPKSTLKLFTPNFVPEDPKAKFNGYIPIDKIQITYSRSSGPGGQNVNTVNSKVDIRFAVKDASWLEEDIRTKLIEENKTRITKEGFLVIKSEITRSQQLNLADALEKLRSLIWKALKPAPQISPESEERLRKRAIRAAQQRLHLKRSRSQTKQQRQAPTVDF